jgi:hypothetical protein
VAGLHRFCTNGPITSRSGRLPKAKTLDVCIFFAGIAMMLECSCVLSILAKSAPMGMSRWEMVMNEAEWLTCTDPEPMLNYLRGKANDRKLRLFGCACCRSGWNLLSRKVRKSLIIAERYADGEVPEQRLWLAGFHARLAAKVEHRREETVKGTAMWAVAWVCERPPAFDGLLKAVEMAAISESYPSDPERLTDAQRKQASLLRCIFGNPFRPASLCPSWTTPTVTAFAKSIYKERCFQDLPNLADALEKAGCTDADILNHCRTEGPHVRGCWVVDLLLGKE